MGMIGGNINPSNASTLAPWFDLVVPNFVEPNSSKTVTIYGGNFDYYTSVKIDGLDLSNITYISDRKIQVDIADTAGTLGVFDIILLNADKPSTSYSPDKGVGAFEVRNITILTPGDNAPWIRVQNATTGIGKISVPNSTSWWDKGGSFGTVPAGVDCELSFEITGTVANYYAMYGLDAVDPNWNYNTIDYAFYIYNSGGIQVRENGASKGSFGFTPIGTNFQIKRVGTQITYHKNGNPTPLYSSGIPSSSALVFDSSMSRNASISNITLTY